VNSAYPARGRGAGGVGLPAWTLLNHTNKVIYSDFIGIDEWPCDGRLTGPMLQAPHESEGCNRLFGDGSASWAGAGPINALRPVDANVPTDQELLDYYRLLDVLP